MDEVKQIFDKADPSPMTTAQLQREVSALKELFETRFNAMDKAVMILQEVANRSPTINEVFLKHEAMFSEMDKSVTVLHEANTALRGQIVDRIAEQIQSLKDVHNERFAALVESFGEKFNSIQTQFRERDVRTEQSSKDSKVAVDAALQAAKEAVGEQNKSSALAIAKSEAATTKQIDQQGLLIQTTAKASDEKIDDIKERLTRIEGIGSGINSNKVEQRAGSHLVLGVLAILLTAAGIMIGILLK